jgi:hypothetical protein
LVASFQEVLEMAQRWRGDGGEEKPPGKVSTEEADDLDDEDENRDRSEANETVDAGKAQPLPRRATIRTVRVRPVR